MYSKFIYNFCASACWQAISSTSYTICQAWIHFAKFAYITRCARSDKPQRSFAVCKRNLLCAKYRKSTSIQHFEQCKQ